MPLLVKDVEWTETEQYVSLKVPLKGASSKNVDIFATNLYIKVSYPPYFYEVALFDAVDDDLSKATIGNGLVTFFLPKIDKLIWGQLHARQSADKEFLRKTRENALSYKQKKEDERMEKIVIEKDRRKKLAVKEQMELDSKECEEIKERKAQEMRQASQELENWKNKNITKKVLTKKTDNPKNETAEKISEKGDIDAVNKKGKTNNADEKENHIEKKEKVIPPPRTSGTINCTFTPRALATPARESKLPEEEMWLQKVAQMNKIRSENSEDAQDIEEMNPMWLKEKGNDFYKKGNYVAAINAYTSALILDSKIPMLYSNRGACHLILKQYNECIQDCTCALELYDPPAPSNAISRCRALTRRGTALFQLEDYVNALKDYEAAMKLDPKNEALQLDARKIRKVIQGEESSD